LEYDIKDYFKSPKAQQAATLISQMNDIEDVKRIWNALLSTSGPNLVVFKEVLNKCQSMNKNQDGLDLFRKLPTSAALTSYIVGKLCHFCGNTDDIDTADILFHIIESNEVRGTVRSFNNRD
jgi:redox-regulated HSP33 family molecular chaperone